MDQPSSYAELDVLYAKHERERTAVGPLGCERRLAVECFFQEIDGLCGRTTRLSELFFQVYNPDAYCVMADFKCQESSRAISLRGNTIKNSPSYIGRVYDGEAFEFCLSFNFLDYKSTTVTVFYYPDKLPLFWCDHDTPAGFRQYFSGRGNQRDQPLSDWSHIPLDDSDEMSFTMNEEHHERICEAYQHFLVWSNDICKTLKQKSGSQKPAEL